MRYTHTCAVPRNQVDQVEKDGEDTLAALKVERPPSAWEFYIARTLADRLQDRPGAMPRFAEAQALHVAGGEASLLLTGLGIFGTLQDLVNAYRIKGQVCAALLTSTRCMIH